MAKERLCDLVSELTREEKARLLSGADFWHTKALPRVGLGSVMMADGPHGLRKEEGGQDNLGFQDSTPATCFPTASAMAASWDRDLLGEIGAALAEECLAQGVSMILGPGVNMKRSPLCGRNFEYFSEDPCLAGELAAAYIQGVQGLGVGTSLKHFAVNSQESFRISVDAVVDERTLRELYLPAFEIAVKKSQPWSVMCSYNRLNGEYASEKPSLLTDILRGEWGFQGLVVSDWGACNDRVRGLKAGLDLEMPYPGGHTDREILAALEDGSLAEEVVDRAVLRILSFVERSEAQRRPGYAFSAEAHHALARRAARESMVLLKNEGGLLPLAPGASVAILGEFAQKPRYQGSGSSMINPSRLDSILGELGDFTTAFTYAQGYSSDSDALDEGLLAEAARAAAAADYALVFVGLTASYENEGLDREHLSLPAPHLALIERAAAANPRTVVVLSNGSAVEMPWLARVPAVLEAFLAGQAGAGAALDLVFGLASPSGKLAESYPASLDDLPSTRHFPEGPHTVEYREGLNVGYRWFDRSGLRPLFPFGHGLSYTTFEYSDLVVSHNVTETGPVVDLAFTLRNTGLRPGAEIAQLYVRDLESTACRPEKELKAFAKVFLEPGEAKTLGLSLDSRAFSFWDSDLGGWRVEGGDFELVLASSSEVPRLRALVSLADSQPGRPPRDRRHDIPSYYGPPEAVFEVPDREFEALLARPLPPKTRHRRLAFDLSSTLGEVRKTFLGSLVFKVALASGRSRVASDKFSQGLLERIVSDMPLRNMASQTMGHPPIGLVKAILFVLNLGRKRPKA